MLFSWLVLTSRIYLLYILPSEYSLHDKTIFPASWNTSTLDAISQEQHSQQNISCIKTCIDISIYTHPYYILHFIS